jgi:hypothetical protein
MTEKMTCEEFNSRLTEFALGRMAAEEAGEMEGHLSSCSGCMAVFEIKQSLIFDPADSEEQVPEEVVKLLVDAVISDIDASREAGRPRRTWASRYLMPALAAAMVVFIFLTGFMLGEINSLHREAGELREEVAVMETVLAGRGSPAGRSVLGQMAGSLTIGEASRFLEALPIDTPVLSEEEAGRLIEEDRRLRRVAGSMKERPWEGGLTSGELLLVIITLDMDPDTRIPDEWRDTYRKAKVSEEEI